MVLIYILMDSTFASSDVAFIYGLRQSLTNGALACARVGLKLDGGLSCPLQE